MNAPAAEVTRARITATVVILTTVNFLNYIDRYVLSAVLEQVNGTFGLSDASGGLLTSMFIVVYMLVSPLTGHLGDRVTRKYLVAGGVFLWSLATIGSGLAQSYGSMLFMRALVGIGEAGYAAVAPAIIADLYTEDRRGRMLAYFYVAIPVGSALGFGLGGAIASNHTAILGLVGLEHLQLEGWRVAFCVAGLPGIVMAVLAAFMHEPVRGAKDEGAYGSDGGATFLASARELWRNLAWRIDTIGLTLMTFAMGGIAAWMPTYLQRAHAMEAGEAGMLFGGVTVVAGLLGTLVGGVLGDRAFAKAQGGYFRLSGWGLLIGAPFALLMPLMPGKAAVLATGFIAEFFLFLNTGPLNAALVCSVGPGLRATAVAVNVLFIHALGDAISPPIMGAISDATGGWFDSAGGGLGLAIALTALPFAAGGWVLLRGASRIDASPDGLRTRVGE